VKVFGEKLREYFEYDWKIPPKMEEFEQIEKRVNDLVELKSMYEELKRNNLEGDYFKELYEINPFM
jgi:dynein heavy chain 2